MYIKHDDNYICMHVYVHRYVCIYIHIHKLAKKKIQKFIKIVSFEQ